MLAAHGAAAWMTGDRSTARRLTSWAALGACLGAVLAVDASPDLRPAAVHLAFWAAATALLCALPMLLRRKSRWLAAAAAVVFLDLFTANSGADLQPYAPGELTPSTTVAELAAAPGRVQNDDRLPRNAGVLHGFEATYGASPLRLAYYDEAYSYLRADNEPRAWQLLAVGSVLTPRPHLPVESAVDVVAGGDQETYLHSLATPTYAWIANVARTVPDAAAAMEQLADPAFPALQTVLLEQGQGPTYDRSAGDRSVVVQLRSPGRTVLSVHQSNTGADQGNEAWLVVSEVHHPGWRATVDGSPALVAKADATLTAVLVPAGDHEVVLSFAAPLVRAGMIISLASALGLVGVSCLLPTRSRSGDDPEGHR